jgi:hypothetical protein
METIIEFLKGTPTWVFVVFGVFLVSGIKALKPHPTSIKKMFILPVVLMILFWMGAEGRSIMIRVPSALIAGWIGWKWMEKIPFKVDVASKTIHFPGSPFPLILFLAIFAIRYFFGALEATNREAFLQWAPYQSLISGIMTGLCFGRVFYVVKAFRKELTQQ